MHVFPANFGWRTRRFICGPRIFQTCSSIYPFPRACCSRRPLCRPLAVSRRIFLRRSAGVEKIVAGSAFIWLAPHRRSQRAAAAVRVRALRCSPRPSTGEIGFFVEHETAQLEVELNGARLATHTSCALPAQRRCYYDLNAMPWRMRTYLTDNLSAADTHVRAKPAAHVHSLYPNPFQPHPHICPRLLCAGEDREFRLCGTSPHEIKPPLSRDSAVRVYVGDVCVQSRW